MNDRAHGGDAAPRPVLFTGDIHLGRRPPALEAVLGAIGIDPSEISAVAAWRAAVAYACERGVRAVVLAGDVVEGENDRFEAFGHLEAGARRLVDAGIPVLAVAGNHDAIALPLLAERIPAVTLLGAGGCWESRPVPGPGAVIDLLGWSFPDRIVREDPTLDPTFSEAIASRRSGAHLVGVVHGDLDAPGSAYAPIDSHRLLDT
ncbi:MAG: DNA repair exonuclease, partial [Acidobacteria bacterium]|nr:DNA repair exonuclease [Acidobacteriota bacterium]